MFTGIIEGRANLLRIDSVGERVELEIDAGERLAGEVGVGDSVALDGCCLTVTARSGGRLGFQIVPETLRRTAFSVRRVGDRVNLERALRVGGRLDGHIVQGHVDGTGTVCDLESVGDDVRMAIECPGEVARLLVPKGSVAVDGVSLTVVDSTNRGFSVALIPHTLAVTTLGERAVGDLVNLEVDVLGKYVHRYLEQLRAAEE